MHYYEKANEIIANKLQTVKCLYEAYGAPNLVCLEREFPLAKHRVRYDKLELYLYTKIHEDKIAVAVGIMHENNFMCGCGTLFDIVEYDPLWGWESALCGLISNISAIAKNLEFIYSKNGSILKVPTFTVGNYTYTINTSGELNIALSAMVQYQILTILK